MEFMIVKFKYLVMLVLQYQDISIDFQPSINYNDSSIEKPNHRIEKYIWNQMATEK